MKKTVLIVDDEPAVRASLRIILMEEFDCLDAGSVKEAIVIFSKNEIDFILLDIRVGDDSGIDFLKYLNRNAISMPVICFSGEASYKEAIEAYQLGALDFLQKPLSSQNLMASIQRCIIQHKVKERSLAILSNIEKQPVLIGESPIIQQLREQIHAIAASDAKVLILGETGTGKEVVAGMIHYNSLRRSGPFIVVNCGSLPATLLESTLFGFKKGAFTGANHDQVGRLECADGGTLFLDELAELSLEGQNSLLRFLETGEIQRVGSNKTCHVNVRVIAATSRNISDAIANGTFRADLYYRLGVFSLRTPELRTIKEDIPLILRSLLESYCYRFNRPLPDMDSELLAQIQSYNWPGNVRELRNLAERFAIVGNRSAFASFNMDGEMKQVSVPNGGSVETHPPVSEIDFSEPLTLKEFRAKTERLFILNVLEIMDGNVTRAARRLGIDRVSLHQKMNRLGIQRK